MYNYSMLLGRVVHDVEIRNTVDGKKVTNLVLAVQRPFKNNETDKYDTDFIEVSIWDALCDIASQYIKKGSVIGVRCRITSRQVTLKSDAVINVLQLVGEKVILVSSSDKSQSDTQTE